MKQMDAVASTIQDLNCLSCDPNTITVNPNIKNHEITCDLLNFLLENIENTEQHSSEFWKTLLIKTSGPLFEMISDVFSKSELNDPYDEFFIVKGSFNDQKLWKDLCSVRSIPNILKTFANSISKVYKAYVLLDIKVSPFD